MGLPTAHEEVVFLTALVVLVFLVLVTASAKTGVLAVVLIAWEIVALEVVWIVFIAGAAKTVLATAELALAAAVIITEHDSGGPAFLPGNKASLGTHAVPLSVKSVGHPFLYAME